MNMKRSCAAGVVLLLLFGLQCICLAAGSAWSQAPNMYRGHQYSSEPKVPSVVADDWVYAGEPITGVRWWGGYWTPVSSGHYGYYANGRPSVSTTAPCNWLITFYENVPAGGSEAYPRPGNAVAQYSFLPDQVLETYHRMTDPGNRNVFSYYVDLPNPFGSQTQAGTPAPGTYWVSIEADMDPISESLQWGWQESPDHRLSTAVQDYRLSGWMQMQNDAYDIDMAFELVAVPEPASLGALIIGLGGISACLLRRR